MPEQPQSPWRNERGAVALTAAICLTALLAAAGLVIDLGHYYLVRQQLKNAADAGALAGVRAIFPYDLKSASLPLDPRCSFAIDTGTVTAQSNHTDNNLSPCVTHIQTGKWDWQKRELIPCCSSDPAGFPNAVTVTTQRADVPLYFMQMFGAKPKTLAATSTAVMDWVKSMKPHGGLGIAIGREWAQEGYLEIPLNDDTSDKGGWYAYPPYKPNDELLVNWLTGEELIPFTASGDSVYLQNGVMRTVLNMVEESFLGKEFYCPVVDTVKFNQTAKVVGFTCFVVTGIIKDNGKHKLVGNARMLAEAPSELAAPGGESFGLLTNAKLVQ